MDARFFIFTKKFGKLAARAKSARKITSKLAGHLEPGSIVSARFVEKSGPMIVDALKLGQAALAVADLYFFNKLLHEGEPDERLWHILLSRDFNWIAALRLLGWDALETACQRCELKQPVAFDVGTQEFLCEKCALQAPVDKLLYITNG